MLRNKLLGAAAAMLMLGQTGAAYAQTTSTGLASNRAALGLPTAKSATACAPTTAGARAECATTGESSELRGRPAGTLIISLAALAALIYGIIKATKGGSSPNSP